MRRGGERRDSCEGFSSLPCCVGGFGGRVTLEGRSDDVVQKVLRSSSAHDSSETGPTPSLTTADDVRSGVWDRGPNVLGEAFPEEKRERRKGSEPSTPSLGS